MISTKILFYIKSSKNVVVKNKVFSQSKIRKTVMKQKFKRKFLLTLDDTNADKRKMVNFGRDLVTSQNLIYIHISNL